MAHALKSKTSYEPAAFQPGWQPPLRLTVGAIGLASIWAASRANKNWRLPILGFGIASLVRALTNRYATELVGLMANPLITIEREIRIAAPADIVFQFLRNFDNYPRFMSFIREVTLDDQGYMQWVLQGPADFRLHWRARLEKLIEEEEIRWQSEPGSPLHASGHFHLRETRDMHTLLQVRLSYAPPAGSLGTLVSHLIGFDPREKIDEDLRVLKSLIQRNVPNFFETMGGPDE